MEEQVLSFVDLLRRNGVRVSTAEVVDALRCTTIPGMLRSRRRLHAAFSATMVTRPEQSDIFDVLFALFFSGTALEEGTDAETRSGTGGAIGATDANRPDVPEETATEEFDGDLDGRSTSSGSAPTDDLTDLFDPEALRDGTGLDDDDTAVGNISTGGSATEVAADDAATDGAGPVMKIDVDGAGGAHSPGALDPSPGVPTDLRLSSDERSALIEWLDGSREAGPDAPESRSPEEIATILRRLPEAFSARLARLRGAGIASSPGDGLRPAIVDDEAERQRELLEASLRRLARSLRGGPTQRTRPHPRGRIHPALTTRRSLRFDGIPFDPVTVRRRDDRAKVVVLADVSLSVRAAARFTVRMIHSMQGSFASVRTLAFVDELVEVTDVLEAHPIDHALGLIFGGEVLETEGNSDYGAVFRQLLGEGERLDRRTSVVILGDGRSNGKDPALDAFAELARRVRRIVWLTPEPAFSWGLGACALPEYAEWCERVDVVRDLTGLERTVDRAAAS